MPAPDTPGGPSPTPTPRPVAPAPEGVSPADYIERIAGIWAEQNPDGTVTNKHVTHCMEIYAAELRAAEL